ncbi:MAG: hypothetical protein JEZ03_11880 [Bacteroidales bacterium]|nr:hypothetical protein [Bacteroidales bacterium]
MKKLVLSLIVLFGVLFQGNVMAQTPEEIAKMPKYGEDSVNCVMKLSLYKEFMRQWKSCKYKCESVNDALPHWRWVFENCPKGSENTYLDGVKIYKYLITKEADKVKKERLIDTLMMIYDQRITYFPTSKSGRSQEGKILGYKGIDLYTYRPQAYNDVHQILKKSIGLEKTASSSASIVYYFRVSMTRYDKGEMDVMDVFDTYDYLFAYAEKNVAKYATAGKKKKEEEWINILGNLENTVEPIATCEMLVPNFQKKFDENPSDIDLLKKMIKKLDKKRCDDSELYFTAVKTLYDLEPTAEAAVLIGKMNVKKENFTEAAQYLEEALPLLTADEDKEQAYFWLANIYNIKADYVQARSMARKAIDLNPNNGDAYILIGDMYGATAKDYVFKGKIKGGYWAAVDKFIKAKQVDPTVAEKANSRIATYSQYFPAVSDIFFVDLNEGDSFKVECWINETTKVRALK